MNYAVPEIGLCEQCVREQSESLAGNAVNKALRSVKSDRHAPEVVDANGIPALKFSGAQYVTLPLGMIPPYAGYRIDMEVYVEKKGGKMFASCCAIQKNML